MAFFKYWAGRLILPLLCVCFLLGGCTGSGVRYLDSSGDPIAEAEKAEAAEPVLQEKKESAAEKAGELQTEAGFLTVFVCGAVNEPGVYELPEGARAVAAVEAAGGFCPGADTEWCNLAQPLEDGKKLRILTLEETDLLRAEGYEQEDAGYSMHEAGGPGSSTAVDSGTGSSSPAEAGAGGLVDLNTATKEQLMTLPGIGEARAESILSWRRQHGPFSDISQIKEISGFKDAIFNGIKDLVTVG